MKKLLFTLLSVFLAVSMSAQSKGYEKTIEIFGGPGLGQYSKYQVGITMINGYRFNDYFFIGAGTGFRFQEARYYISYGPGDTYDYDSRIERYIIPVYARLKANLGSSAKVRGRLFD